jgi:hypothetical protein
VTVTDTVTDWKVENILFNVYTVPAAAVAAPGWVMARESIQLSASAGSGSYNFGIVSGGGSFEDITGNTAKYVAGNNDAVVRVGRYHDWPTICRAHHSRLFSTLNQLTAGQL